MKRKALWISIALIIACGDDTDPVSDAAVDMDGDRPDGGVDGGRDAGDPADANDDSGEVDAGPRCPTVPESEVEITFPARNALTDADNIQIAGLVDSELPVTAVTINGAPAAARDADLHDWQARVDLIEGINEFDVVVTLEGGEERTVPVQVRRSPIAARLRDIAWDPDGQRAFVLTATQLLAVDSNGDMTVFATPSENRNYTSGRLALDSTGGRLFVMETPFHLVSLDLSTGAATPLNAPMMTQSPRDIVYDTSRDRLVISSFEDGSVRAIDPATGMETTISGADETPELVLAGDLAVDPSGTIFVIDNDANGTVLSIDADTGAREALTLDPAVTRPFRLVWNPISGRLIAAAARPAVVEIDPATGSVSELFTHGVIDPTNSDVSGSTPSINGISVDVVGGRVIAIEHTKALIFAVHIDNSAAANEREAAPLVDSQTVGTGVAMQFIESIQPQSRRSVLIAEQIDDRVLSVDLETGDRCILSDRALTADMLNPYEVRIAPDGAAAIVAAHSMLLELDLHSGGVTLISGTNIFSNESAGSGPEMYDNLEGMDVDWSTRRAYVAGVLDENYVLAVDLDSGERTVVSAVTEEPLLVPNELRLDLDNQRVLMLDGNARQLLAFALADGARTVLSDETSPGQPFSNASSLALESASHVFVGSRRRIDRVALADGSRTALSGQNFPADSGSGVDFEQRITAIHYDAMGHRLLVGDDETNALYVVDTNTGERAIISR